MSREPVVSIGLPTFNRAATLRRTIESARNQDYQNFELLISDNASTDETEAICLDAAQQDSRVKYFRSPTNLGASANFREVLNRASGEFFMWLGDDDWLDHSYIARCVEVLNKHPDYSLVCGEATYYENGRVVCAGEPMDLPQTSSAERVVSYYAQVLNNGAFYGVMRLRQIDSAWIRNELGGDWHVIAALAFKGKITTIASTTVSRNLGGASRTPKSITETLGISRMHSRAPRLSIAVNACKDIAWRSGVYDSLDRRARIALAFRVFSVFNRRFFKPYWWDTLYPYWAPPILYALSVKNKVRKKMLGPSDD